MPLNENMLYTLKCYAEAQESALIKASILELVQEATESRKIISSLRHEIDSKNKQIRDIRIYASQGGSSFK